MTLICLSLSYFSLERNKKLFTISSLKQNTLNEMKLKSNGTQTTAAKTATKKNMTDVTYALFFAIMNGVEQRQCFMNYDFVCVINVRTNAKAIIISICYFISIDCHFFRTVIQLKVIQLYVEHTLDMLIHADAIDISAFLLSVTLNGSSLIAFCTDYASAVAHTY